MFPTPPTPDPVAVSFVFVGGRLAVDLLNTRVASNGRRVELLPSWAALVGWALAAGMDPLGPAARGEPARLRRFREALRRGLLVWSGTGHSAPGLTALLNRTMARDPQQRQLADTSAGVESRWQSAGRPLDRLYGAIARSAAELVVTGEPDRLRKCANPACVLMFYDDSKAGRRRWCSMDSCGARSKMRAFYRRRQRTRPR